MCKCVFCNEKVKSIGGRVYLDKYPPKESGLYCEVDGEDLIVCDACYERNKFVVLKNINNLHGFYKKILKRT